MRKIEQQMTEAMAKLQEWSKDNTEVLYCHEISGDPHWEVRLHGNPIAFKLRDGPWQIDEDVLETWPTVTTRSRLNAMGFNVSVRNHKPYIGARKVRTSERYMHDALEILGRHHDTRDLLPRHGARNRKEAVVNVYRGDPWTTQTTLWIDRYRERFQVASRGRGNTDWMGFDEAVSYILLTLGGKQ